MTTLINNIALEPKDYRSGIEPTWCPGCGDFSVLNSLTQTMSASKIDPFNSVVVSGIGCSSRTPLWMKNYGFHSVHGRALPVAVGMALVNPDMPITVTIGDGDCFSIGGGHVPHAARRNFNMRLFVMDNQAFALTKNQVSPTSREGLKTSTTPFGNIDAPMNTIALMLSYGATFVAQTFAGNPKHMTETMNKAMAHKGFAFVNILSPCPTFNKTDTFVYYRGRVHDINETHTDLTNMAKAQELAATAIEHGYDENAKVPIGVFYQVEKPTYGEKLKALKERVGAKDKPDFKAIFDQYKP